MTCRGTDAFLGLVDRLVRQTDDREARQRLPDVRLHVHHVPLQTD